MSTDDNKALVRRWFSETDLGNDGLVEELCSPDYVDHSPPPPSSDDTPTVFARDRGAGRPTKRDRRRLDRFRGG